MITAEEFLDGILNADTIAWNPEIDNVYGCINLAMVEFAKMHVEAALKKASESAKIKYEYSGNTGSEYCDEYVDTQSILKSYPLENIK